MFTLYAVSYEYNLLCCDCILVFYSCKQVFQNTVSSTCKIKISFVVCSSLWVCFGESDQVRPKKVPGKSVLRFIDWCFSLNTDKLGILDSLSIFIKTTFTWLPVLVTKLLL